MNKQKIVLKGQKYASPQTESVEIISQGVLCASGTPNFYGDGFHFNSKTGKW